MTDPMIGRAATILIVDDEAQNRKLLEALLKPEGYITRGAASGEEALAAVAQHAPDLILLDVMMPGMDGFAVAAKLKANPDASHIPIIMVTALVDRDARLAGLKAGAEEFLTKPVDRAELWLRVRNLLRLKAFGDFLQNHSAILEETVQRRTAELRQSEARFSVFMEASPVLAWVKDPDGRYLYTNNAWDAIFDIAPDGGPILKNGNEIPETLVQMKARDKQVLTSLEANQELVRMPDASGEMRSWNCIRFPIQETSGRTSIGGIAIDVTQQTIAESEILNLNAHLEQRVEDRTADLEHARDDANLASQAKSSFLAAMSHEIRTPMNGVIGMVDVLHQTNLDNYQVEMVDLIRESAFSLLTIIDDILDFSKIEAGRMEIESVPISVADVVEKACGMLDHVASKNGVELTLFVDPSLPEAVLGDGLRMRQVLLNIVSNAIKFSSGRRQTGRVSVRVVPTERSPGQVVVEIQVKDNGIGMDEAAKARLFNAFTQADTSTTRRFGGTGLGLVISRRLVELMGGGFLLHSTPGQGSTFTMDLQFALLKDDTAPVAALSEVDGLSCLVVGGPDGLATNIAAYLTHGGARVERAADLGHARTLMLGQAPGPWTWIIDAADIPPPENELKALAHSLPLQEIGFVGIGRGSRRTPRAKNAALVLVDGNLLTRRRLFRAVAIAAGRAAEEAQKPVSAKPAMAFEAPSRQEARSRSQLILVAEDNPTNQKVILRQLALLGFAADTAADGKEALKLWQTGDYALLLSDVNMPEMDGFELTAEIRAQEHGAHRFPIVAVTANALSDEAENCRQAGMDDYLSKPLQLADLKAMLLKWLPGANKDVPLPAALPGHSSRPRAVALDVGILESVVGTDPALVLEFLLEFQLSARDIAGLLRAACSDGGSEQAYTQAHKLRSSARTVGALPLADLCAEIELAGRAGSTEKLTALWPGFERELTEVNRHIDSLQAAGADSGATGG